MTCHASKIQPYNFERMQEKVLFEYKQPQDGEVVIINDTAYRYKDSKWKLIGHISEYKDGDVIAVNGNTYVMSDGKWTQLGSIEATSDTVNISGADNQILMTTAQSAVMLAPDGRVIATLDSSPEKKHVTTYQGHEVKIKGDNVEFSATDKNDFNDRNITINVVVKDTVVNKKTRWSFDGSYYHGNWDSYKNAISAITANVVMTVTKYAKDNKNIAYM